MPRSKTKTLSDLRQEERFLGEVTNPISFPVHYVLQVDTPGELLILCHLVQREFPFAMWTKKGGLTPISFEPFHSLSINACLPSISEFCEQIHDAWCAGNQAGPADCDDSDRRSTPTDGGADEASS